MIYSIHVAQFTSPYTDQEISLRIVRLIKYAPKEDKFLAVATTSQIDSFKDFISKHELNSLIRYQSPTPLTNGSHPHLGKRLNLFVLSKTNLKESEYGISTNTRGKIRGASLAGSTDTSTS